MPNIRRIIASKLNDLLARAGYYNLNNRLRNLHSGKVSPLNLDQALISFMGGSPSALDRIFNKIEIDEQVSACMESRNSSTSGLNLHFSAPEDDAAAQQQIDFLDAIFKDLSVDNLLEEILAARYRLFKIITPDWKLLDNKVQLTGWKAWENEYFTFDQGDIYLNAGGKKSEFANGNDDWYSAVKVRDRKSILLRCVKPYIIRTFGYDAWAHFIEVFSDPFRVGKYPDGAGKEIRDQVWEAVRTIGQDGSAALPASAQIEFVENSRTGGQTFGDLVEKVEASISKAILGHSAAADATPGKLGEEGNALQARDDLVKTDRRFALRWLYRGFVRPLLIFNFSAPAPILPVLTESKVITRDELRQSLRLYWEMGGEVDPQQFEEMGVRVQEGAPLLKKSTDFVF